MSDFNDSYNARSEKDGIISSSGITIRQRLAADFMVAYIHKGHGAAMAAYLAVMAAWKLEKALKNLNDIE